MTDQLAYTFRQAAQALGFKDSSLLRELYRKGELKAGSITDNGDLRISRDELERLLRERGIK